MATKVILLFHEEREKLTHTHTHTHMLYGSFHSHRDITFPHPVTCASHFPMTMQLLGWEVTGSGNYLLAPSTL